MTLKEAIASLNMDAEHVALDTAEVKLSKQAQRFIDAVRAVTQAIESMPVWTPCSERIPEEGKPCYITTVRTYKDGSEHWYVVDGYFARGCWFDKRGWKINSKDVYSWNMTAIAWQLNIVPEPYNPNKAQEA